MADLTELMVSVHSEMEKQTSILKSLLDLQIKESAEAKRRYELDRAQRDSVAPVPPNRNNRDTDSQPTEETGSSTLGGFLAGLMALFGPSTLSAVGALSTGAIALTASLGIAFAAMRGQITAISTFLKTVGVDIQKSFGTFVKSIDAFVKSIDDGFKNILRDLRIRVAFIRVTIAGVFDDFVKFIKTSFSSSPNSKFSTVFNGIKKTLDILIEPFKVALKTISELAGPGGSPSKMTGILKSIGTWFKGIAKMLGSISSVAGKLFAPIAIILTVFETIKGIMNGYAEGGIIGALKGGIIGFFNSLILGPLDLVKDLISWVSKKLGFENFSNILDSFSFADLFTSMIDNLFNGIKGAFSIISDIFTFTEEDMSALGLLGKLTDLVYAPVNMAINYVKGLFGFEETEEPFKLQDWYFEKINSIWESIKGVFDFIPSGDAIKKFMLDSLPAPLKKLFSGDSNNNGYSNNMNSFTEDYSFADGTRGFQNFGSGTPTILHGMEAVIPRNTDAGNFLATNFDDSWNMKLAKMSSSLGITPAPIIINAPNNSTTQVNQTGGSASSVINSFGGNSRNDLDYMSRPAGVN